jgi:hypothetical protein
LKEADHDRMDQSYEPKKTAVYLSVDQLMRVRPCVQGVDFTPPSDLSAANSIIDLATGMQAVLETPAKIMELIEEAQNGTDKAAGA